MIKKDLVFLLLTSETHSGPCQTSEMEIFTTDIGWKPSNALNLDTFATCKYELK